MKFTRTYALALLFAASIPGCVRAQAEPGAQTLGGEDLTPAALLVRGQERFSKGDFDKAIEYWAGAAARDSELQEQLAPKLADAYRKRGALRYQAREYEEAYSDLREAMRLDPDSQNTRAACLLADQARSSPPRERPAAAASVAPDSADAPLDEIPRWNKSFAVMKPGGRSGRTPLPRPADEKFGLMDVLNILLILFVLLLAVCSRWYAGLPRPAKAAFMLGLAVFGYKMPGFIFFAGIAVALLLAAEKGLPPPHRGT